MDRLIDALNLFFTGRVGRLHYLFACIGWSILGLILFFGLGFVLKSQFTLFVAGLLAMLVSWALITIFITRLEVRRLHDINLSGWWALAVAIPPWVSLVVGWLEPGQTIGPSIQLWVVELDVFDLWTLLASTILVFWPGSRGPNRFGPYPRIVLTEQT